MNIPKDFEAPQFKILINLFQGGRSHVGKTERVVVVVVVVVSIRSSRRLTMDRLVFFRGVVIIVILVQSYRGA